MEILWRKDRDYSYNSKEVCKLLNKQTSDRSLNPHCQIVTWSRRPARIEKGTHLCSQLTRCISDHMGSTQDNLSQNHDDTKYGYDRVRKVKCFVPDSAVNPLSSCLHDAILFSAEAARENKKKSGSDLVAIGQAEYLAPRSGRRRTMEYKHWINFQCILTSRRFKIIRQVRGVVILISGLCRKAIRRQVPDYKFNLFEALQGAIWR